MFILRHETWRVTVQKIEYVEHKQLGDLMT